MRDLLTIIEEWRQKGDRIALATVVKVWGSAPRPLGAQMVVSSRGGIAGSVSGGCVEGAVFEEAQGVLETGQPKLVSFGVSQDTAWSVGLACGGTIDVWIEPLEESFYKTIRDCILADQGIARSTVVDGDIAGRWSLFAPSRPVDKGDRPADDAVLASSAEEALIKQRPARLSVPLNGQSQDVFVEVYLPRRKLIVVGAVHAAIPLVRFAKELGFRTYVVDPRTVFASPERFSHADEVLTDWPDESLEKIGLQESSYVVLLSHDLKLDIPALKVALPSSARYIGALGSKKTHARRCEKLREDGFSENEIAGVHNPVGLNLGGRKAEEMALSILAEIVAVSHGRDLRR